MQHKGNIVHQYFQNTNLGPFSNSLDTPIKELIDLNMQTLHNFSYFKPDELLGMRRPEALVEKNLELFMENSHTALNYMQNMFHIMEKHWLKNIEAGVKSTSSLGGFTKNLYASVPIVSTPDTKKSSSIASKKTKSATPSKPSSAKIVKTTPVPSKLASSKKTLGAQSNATGVKQATKTKMVNKPKTRPLSAHNLSKGIKH